MLTAGSAAAVALALLAPSHGRDAPGTGTIRLTTEQIRIAGIRVEAVSAARTAATRNSEASGTRLSGQVLPPGDRANAISTSVAGYLDAMMVQVGERVTAGRALARIRSAELAGLQREYLHARANAELATARLVRDESLFGDGIITQSRLNESRAARELALANAEEQRHALRLAGYSDAEIARLRADRISSTVTLRAANAATVLDEPIAVDQHVEAGATVLRISSPGSWWLDLQATPAQAAELSVGDAVQAGPCKALGRIIGIGSQVNAQAQTVLVRAQLQDPTGCLRANQYLEAAVLGGDIPASWVRVPASALVRSGGRDYVFLQQGTEFRPVAVLVARRATDQAWLRSGVAPGSSVAASGTAVLKGAWLGLGAQGTQGS